MSSSRKSNLSCKRAAKRWPPPLPRCSPLAAANFLLLLPSEYMSDSQDALATLTAQAGDEAFNKFFPVDQTKGLDSNRTTLYEAIHVVQTKLESIDASSVPSRELFELYLFAIHWLLIVDKVSLTRLYSLKGRMLTN